ncbi:MAG: cupredoxin domain-containing protein [Ferruginibacter sp.]
MSKFRMNYVLIAMFTIMFLSCTKSSQDFQGQGGLLPTNYVIINDNGFSPASLTIAVGSSITFVNSTIEEHSIVSDDSSTIITNVIMPNTSFYYKKDTVGTFSYHCGNHPTARGTIILRP